MIFATDIDPAARTLRVAGGVRYFGRTEFRLFSVFYEADLETGEWLSPAQLLDRLYVGRDKPRTLSTLRYYLSSLRGKLAQSRFRIEHDKHHGYRFVVAPLARPPAPVMPEAAGSRPDRRFVVKRPASPQPPAPARSALQTAQSLVDDASPRLRAIAALAMAALALPALGEENLTASPADARPPTIGTYLDETVLVMRLLQRAIAGLAVGPDRR